MYATFKTYLGVIHKRAIGAIPVARLLSLFQLVDNQGLLQNHSEP